MRSKNFLIAWLPVAAWMILIFFASTDLGSAEHTSRFLIPFLKWMKPDISPEAINAIQFLVRKTAHLLAYAILAALVWQAVLAGTVGRRAGISFLVSTSYAVMDEFHQSFIGSRTASPRDVLIDGAGAALAILFCWWLNRGVRANPACRDEIGE